MVGHLIRVEVFTSFNKLFTLLSEKFGKIFHIAFKTEKGRKIGFILGEKLYLSTTSVVGLVIIIEEIESDKQRVDLISFAGGAGLLKLSLGTHISYIRDVLIFLENNGVQFRELMEIGFLSRKKLPEDVRKNLERILSH